MVISKVQKKLLRSLDIPLFLSAILSTSVLSPFQLPYYLTMGAAVPYVTERITISYGGKRDAVHSNLIKETFPKCLTVDVPSHPIEQNYIKS